MTPDEAREATDATSNGQPDRALLQSAVRTVVQRMNPDQVILFGSAARGEMNENSDLDLLVVTEGRPEETRSKQHRWTDDRWPRQIHILEASREIAEAGRLIAGDFRQHALEEGLTLYTRKGVTPIATARGNPETKEMIRKSRLDPEHGSFFMKRAKTHQEEANRTDHQHGAWWQCENAARCLEYCYKALLASLGKRVKHTHDLNVLQAECTAAGAKQPATRDTALLKTMTEYNRDYQYEEEPPDVEGKKTLDKALPLTNAVYEYATRQAPVFAERTRTALAESEQSME